MKIWKKKRGGCEKKFGGVNSNFLLSDRHGYKIVAHLTGINDPIKEPKVFHFGMQPNE